MNSCNIERLDATTGRAAVPELAEILVDCVDGGASVSFMAPLSLERAAAFWHGVVDGVARGERTLLLARDGKGAAIGTVQLILAQPENQPHRADVAKLLVHRRARRSGAGELLMREIERLAFVAGKTVLVLDTASADAERLYQRLGWTVCGVIPNYALNPDGSFCDTTVYWKALS